MAKHKFYSEIEFFDGYSDEYIEQKTKEYFNELKVIKRRNEQSKEVVSWKDLNFI